MRELLPFLACARVYPRDFIECSKGDGHQAADVACNLLSVCVFFCCACLFAQVNVQYGIPTRPNLRFSCGEYFGGARFIAQNALSQVHIPNQFTDDEWA